MRSRPDQEKQEFFAPAGAEASAVPDCPGGAAVHAPARQLSSADITPELFDEILRAAVDWQYLIVLSGGMARKSDCEAWLTMHFGIDTYTGRQITNTITSGPFYFVIGGDGVRWQEWVAGRPAPRPEDYPDIDYSVGTI